MHFVVTVCVILCLLTLPANASPEQWNEWLYRRPILVSSPAGPTVALRLPNDIWGICLPDLADIRIVTSSGEEVPYELVTEGSTEQEKRREAKIVGKFFVPRSHQSLTIDLGSNVYHNRVTIHTSHGDFIHKVSVSSGNDGLHWTVRNEHSVIADLRSGSGRLRLCTISYPETSDRYLRLVIYEHEGLELPVDSVSVSYLTGRPPVDVDIPFILHSYEDEPDTQRQTFVLDLGFEGLPSYRISLTSRDENFHRIVEVFKGDDLENWFFCGSAMVHKYDTGTFKSAHMDVIHPEMPGRYVKIVVHGSAQISSMDILGVGRVQRTLLFEYDATQSYFLYCGNDECPPPRYGYKQYTLGLKSDGLPLATLGPPEPNPHYAVDVQSVAQLSLRLWYLLAGGFGLLVGLGGAIRKIK